MGIVDKSLIKVGLQVDNSTQALQVMGQLLLEHGYVKESYIKAIVEREEVYPTGLNLQTISIAMPHTDPTHVKKPAIAIATLKKPVMFQHMGNTKEQVAASILFVMAIQDPKEQIDNLRKVMQAFSDPAIVKKFQNAKDDAEVYELGKQYFN